MHFIVLGAGAIGCYVGGRLAAHGQPVCLVGRPHALEPIALHGLKVTDLDGFDRTVPVSALQLAHTLADAAPGPDSIILLCVKSGATESAARELADACAPGTPVISLQNGVDNVARVTARAPGLSVLAGMVPYNVVLRGASAVLPSHQPAPSYTSILKHPLPDPAHNVPAALERHDLAAPDESLVLLFLARIPGHGRDLGERRQALKVAHHALAHRGIGQGAPQGADVLQRVRGVGC